MAVPLCYGWMSRLLERTMIELDGRVVVDRIGSAVAGVVVEAFDLTRADTKRTTRLRDTAELLSQPSIGSDITDADGAFHISAEFDAGALIPIGLVVFGTDGPASAKSEIIHVVQRVRTVRDGRQRYVISLPADALRRVPASSLASAVAPDAKVAVVSTAAERASTAEAIGAGLARLRSDALDARRTTRETAEANVRDALFERALGSRRLANGKLPPEVLGPGENARAKTSALLNGTLLSRANHVTARSIVDVTDADVAALLDQNGAPLPTVTQGEIETLLFGPSHLDGVPTRYRRDPIAVACRSRIPPDARCAVDDGSGAGSSGSGSGAGQPTEATLADIKASLLRLLDGSEAAVAGLMFGGSRATAGELGRDLRALTLAEGPADQTAQFNFERLFLASDLLVSHFPDIRVVTDFADTILSMQGLGAKVTPQPGRGKDLLDSLEAEARLLATADPLRAPTSPPRVMAMLGIPNPLDVVDDLVGGAIGGLAGLLGGGGSKGGSSTDVRDHRGGSTSTWQPERRDRFADLRTFIDRLRRIRREDYGFTAFAVDRNGRACTYGLLLAFEQEWVP
jgi:hypothetical protein